MVKKLLLISTLVVLALGLWLAAQAGMVQAQTPTVEATPPAAEEGNQPRPTTLLDDVIITRTPMPTTTPGPLSRQVERLAYEAGLARTTFLGLTIPDWINLSISLMWIIGGYVLGTLLIRRLLPRLAQRYDNELAAKLLDRSGSGIRWLVVLILAYLGTTRLSFVSAEVKSLLLDAYFVIGLFLVVRIVWQALDLSDTWYRHHLAAEERLEDLDPILTLLVRVGRVLLVLMAVIFLLSHFGVNVTGFAAALGLGGLAFSLAARDTIADAIAGFIILVDRPFRIGDRIQIEKVNTWGDVVDIGLRTTRIRTRDNRMVIIPNSVIGINEIINYSYPDPRYRIETHVGLAYGTDIEHARQVLIDAVRKVPGVLPDRPVDALYIEMGDSAMIFRVRWWLESYQDTRRMYDQVHTALQHAIDEAGIESPFPTQTINIPDGPDGGP